MYRPSTISPAKIPARTAQKIPMLKVITASMLYTVSLAQPRARELDCASTLSCMPITEAVV
ncbi:hypothetical protein BDV06DRAFT_182387 [Aspergillus oleicola]